MDLRHLEFCPPDMEKFPCLELAYRAAEAGGAHTVALNAADEVAVASFLDGSIGFEEVPEIIAAVLAETRSTPLESIREVLKVDGEARHTAHKKVEEHSCPKAASPRN